MPGVKIEIMFRGRIIYSISRFCRGIVLFLPGALLLWHGFAGCNNGKPVEANRHISDSLFFDLNGRFNSLDSATSAKTLDSLFSAFPDVSKADSFFYLSLKRTIVYRSDQSRTGIALTYTDSMLGVLTASGLQKQMKKEYLRTLLDKANLFVDAKKYSEAVDLVSQCVFQNSQDGDSAGVADNMFTLAYIAFKQDKIDSAIKILQDGYRMIRYFDNPQYRFFRSQRTLDDIGFMYRLNGEMDSALKYHVAAKNYVLENTGEISPADSLYKYRVLLNIYDNISAVYLARQNADSAGKYIAEAVANAMRLNEEGIKTRILSNLYQKQADTYFMLGDIKKADSLNKAANVNYDLLTDETKDKLLELEYKIDSIKGNYTKMAEDLSRFIRFKDIQATATIEALKKNPQEVYENLERKYELELKNRDIRLQRTKANAALVAGALFLALAGTLFFNLRKIRQVMKKLRATMREVQIQQKQKSEEQLRFQEIQLQMRHNETIDRQRREISNDLHDSLSSSLAALRYYIEDLKLRDVNKGHEKVFDEIRAEVGSIYTTTRQYMHDLNAGKHTVQHDLSEQLEDLARKFSDKASFSISLEIDKEGIEQYLDMNQQDQLYYILNEAVSNTIKYANATRTHVSIRFTNTDCLFSVSDNGSGFDFSEINSGLGLRSMYSRIEKLNGTLQISPGINGTTINGSFPLDTDSSFDFS